MKSIEKNQTHSNSIVDDQVLDIKEHPTPTENADIETKFESENISIDVKDFELKSTSEKVLTQSDVQIGESVFDLDNFLSSQQTSILEPSTKPEMPTIDAENESITTSSNAQTANDSESYNLCDFSIESEPSLIAQDFASTLEASNESPINRESDASMFGTDDQIENKLIDDAKSQGEDNAKEIICDSIEG